MLYCNVTKILWPSGNVHDIITCVSIASYPSLVSKSIKAYRFPFKNSCDSLLFLNVSLKCRIFVKITMSKQTFNMNVLYLYWYILPDKLQWQHPVTIHSRRQQDGFWTGWSWSAQPGWPAWRKRIPGEAWAA